MTAPQPPDRVLRLRRDAIRDGWSDGELARLTRSKEWSRVRRGAYVDGQLPTDVVARHALLIQSTVAGLRRPAVVSHQSAAVLHGMTLWNVDLDRVHVTRRPRAWNDSSGVLCCHVARLRDDEVTWVAGLEVTTPVRTALDLARSLPFESAVVALDDALHRKLLPHDVLREKLFDIAGTRGSRAGARAVRFADERSESVGESRSRVALSDLGLAPSGLQWAIPTGGRVVRTDFVWEEQRVVGEFDGRIKYGRLLRPGQDPGDAVFEEKRREDEIRAEGWGVVRWTWADLATRGRLGARVRRALDGGTRR